MCIRDRSPEVNSAKCIGGTALGFAIVTLIGFAIVPWGLVSALAGLFGVIAGSIVCCCGPKAKGAGAGKFTAAMVLNIIACILHFAAIIGIVVFYLGMLAHVNAETAKCVECACRTEYQNEQSTSTAETTWTVDCSSSTESPNWSDEMGSCCDDWSGYDCTTAQSYYGYTPEGETELLEKCPTTCAEYTTTRRLQEVQEIEQTLKIAALVGIKADAKHVTKARRLQQRTAAEQAEYERCTALVETEMTADEQAYYETCRDGDQGWKQICDLINLFLVIALTFYLIVMIPTIIFALIAGILEAVGAAKCSAAKAAILADGPSTASV